LLREEAKRLLYEPAEVGGLTIVVDDVPLADQKQLLELASQVRSSLPDDSAVALGGAEGDKVGLVVLISKGGVARGLSAAAIVREAAAVVGGGGGGRDDMAQAGGKDASRLEEAMETARRAIEAGVS
jgi:alanyl-tRNA synthetase